MVESSQRWRLRVCGIIDLVPLVPSAVIQGKSPAVARYRALGSRDS